MKNATKNTIRFLAHSVKNGDLSARVHYSEGRTWNGNELVVSIYAKDYSDDLAAIFADEYTNNTDLMTDYHEKGHVRLNETHPLYSAALKRCRENRAKDEARWEKTQANRAARYAAKRAS